MSCYYVGLMRKKRQCSNYAVAIYAMFNTGLPSDYAVVGGEGGGCGERGWPPCWSLSPHSLWGCGRLHFRHTCAYRHCGNLQRDPPGELKYRRSVHGLEAQPDGVGADSPGALQDSSARLGYLLPRVRGHIPASYEYPPDNISSGE